MKRRRYSIHLIPSTGQPRPVAASETLAPALNEAEDKARDTGLEVRVWDTQIVRCIYTVASRQETT